MEKLIRSVTDSGKGAILFCDIALLFRKEGAEKISGRLLQSAIKEAPDYPAPFTESYFIMCDIAMKTHASSSRNRSGGS